MLSSLARVACRSVVTEALESRTFLSSTPVFINEVVSTGKLIKFQASIATGQGFEVDIKRGKVDMFSVDNRLQLSVTGTDSKSKIAVSGDVQLADVKITGDLNLFQAPGIALTGIMSVTGSLKKVVLDGMSGGLVVAGTLGNAQFGGVTGTIAVAGAIGKLSTTSLNSATVVSGSELSLAGNVPTYGPGSIKSILVSGPVINSTIDVGASPGIDNAFGTADDVSAGGGPFQKLTVLGGADSSSRFEAGTFSNIKINPVGTEDPARRDINFRADPRIVMLTI
jgi:hypothetical protein